MNTSFLRLPYDFFIIAWLVSCYYWPDVFIALLPWPAWLVVFPFVFVGGFVISSYRPK